MTALSFSDEQRFRAGNIRGNDYLMTFEELGVEARGGGKAGEARGGGEGVL